MDMQIGKFKQKASSFLSVFVMICSVVIVMLLYLMQKSEAVASSLEQKGDYSMYE